MIEGFPNPPAHAAADPGPLVCVVDNDESIRTSLERLFRSAHLPVRTYASAKSYLEQERHPGSCCLILDVNMPELDGFGLQEIIADQSARIVFLTGHGDVPKCARAMKAGAVDFLTKPADDEILLAAAHNALAKSRELLAETTVRDQARRKLASLTPREAAVMRRVINGMLNKHIAADLCIAEKTVKVHRGRMMRKAGVVSVPDLLRLAQAAGAIEYSKAGHES